MSTPLDHGRPPPNLLWGAYILSTILAAFAGIMWAVTGGLLPWPGFEALTVANMVPALYAALAVLMQLIAAGAARAARWAQKMIGADDEAAKMARAVVWAAGLWNAYSLHNGFEHALPDGADVVTVGIAWLVSGAVAFVEIKVYDVDESLKSAYARSQAEAHQAWEDGRRAQSKGSAGGKLTSAEVAALSNESLEQMIRFHTGQKKLAETQRRRRKENLVAKERIKKH